MNKATFFKIPFTLEKREAILKYALNFIETNSESFQIIGVEPETIIKASESLPLLQTLKDCNIVTIDGSGIYLAFLLKGILPPERIPCPDLMNLMLEIANERNFGIYILGSQQSVLQKAIKNIKHEFPKIVIKGYKHGYYDRNKELSVLQEIISAQPDFLFLALPTPEKEILGKKIKKELKSCIILGVGGAIDIWGEKYKRAPKILQKFGLEFFYRIIINPKEFGTRTIISIPKFVHIIINEIFHLN